MLDSLFRGKMLLRVCLMFYGLSVLIFHQVIRHLMTGSSSALAMSGTTIRGNKVELNRVMTIIKEIVAYACVQVWLFGITVFASLTTLVLVIRLHELKIAYRELLLMSL